MAAFSGSEVTWQAAVACIRDVLGPYRLTVTTTDPGLTPHHEAVIAGLPSQIGMGSGVSGVSPFSCGEIPRTITFTFGNLFPEDVLELCWTATHEIAHSFGLEHEMYCPDSMTYQPDCGFKRYTDVLADVGTAGQCLPANECQCGRSQQNAHQMMLGAVGTNPQVFGDGFESATAGKLNWREVLKTRDANRRFEGRCGTTDRPVDRSLSGWLELPR
ncbi:MAG: hypothetical protein IPK97_20725 [Ahniella sp.]|nr:hypothetical protein [Ahniella sp.]